MLTPKKTRDLARSLVAREADSNTTSLQTEPASARVFEKLRRQFGASVGAYGFQSLAARALALARSESPHLKAVQVMANGGLRGLDEVESQTSSDEVGEVGIILIAQLLGLFLTLLGEATTLRLIEDLRLQAEIRTESVEEGERTYWKPGRQTSGHGGRTFERCWKCSQHCHGSGRFHTYPKQGRRLAGRRTGPTNEPLYELSGDGARLRFRTSWMVKTWIQTSLTACSLAKQCLHLNLALGAMRD